MNRPWISGTPIAGRPHMNPSPTTPPDPAPLTASVVQANAQTEVRQTTFSFRNVRSHPTFVVVFDAADGVSLEGWYKGQFKDLSEDVEDKKEIPFHRRAGCREVSPDTITVWRKAEKPQEHTTSVRPPPGFPGSPVPVDLHRTSRSNSKARRTSATRGLWPTRRRRRRQNRRSRRRTSPGCKGRWPRWKRTTAASAKASRRPGTKAPKPRRTGAGRSRPEEQRGRRAGQAERSGLRAQRRRTRRVRRTCSRSRRS